MKKKNISSRVPVVKSLCHAGRILVFQTREMRVYGGNTHCISDIKEKDVVINLTGEDEKLVRSNSAMFKHLEKYNENINTLSIDWPDFYVPDLNLDFWTDLCETLITEGKKEKINVLVCCEGGHGRTGTALGILGCLLGAVPDHMCPVEWVRSRYCKNAVETERQVKYISDITGRSVTTVTDWKSFAYFGHERRWF
jgi:protein-tyrosine phosphatase